MTKKLKVKRLSRSSPGKVIEDDIVEVPYTNNDMGAKELSPEHFEEAFRVLPVNILKDYPPADTQFDILDRLTSFFEFVEDDELFSFDGMFLTAADREDVRKRLKEQREEIERFKASVPDYDVRILDRNIEYLLELRGATRNDLSALIGVSPSYFPRVLNPSDEKRRMSVEVLWKIAGFLDVSTDRLLSEDLREIAMAGVNKASRFLIDLQEATLKHKISWNHIDPVKNKDDKDLLDGMLYMGSFVDEDVAYDYVWCAETENGKVYYAHELGDGDFSTLALYGSDGKDVKKLFATKNDDITELAGCFLKLEEVITSHYDEFYLTDEASNFMDNFLK